jgi:hypothetical protein
VTVIGKFYLFLYADPNKSKPLDTWLRYIKPRQGAVGEWGFKKSGVYLPAWRTSSRDGGK